MLQPESKEGVVGTSRLGGFHQDLGSRTEVFRGRSKKQGPVMLQPESKKGLVGTKIHPVSYTHLTLPTNREV